MENKQSTAKINLTENEMRKFLLLYVLQIMMFTILNSHTIEIPHFTM